MGKSSQNSATNCRQAPQGAAPPWVATANIENLVSPADTAAAIATRSAHSVRPNEAFSTFAPV
jgi:hypothetical protein